MERFDDKQRKVFHAFYLACNSKGIDPLGSEAGRQRALLLAQEKPELVKLLGGSDGWQVEAYRLGREYAREKANAESKAAEDAKIAEQRSLDTQAAALERTISNLRGREKRTFFLQKRLEQARENLKDAQDCMDRFLRRYEQTKRAAEGGGDSWGTLGGIAAGVTGSTAAGAVIAADAMGRDAANRSLNESLRQNMLMNEFPIWQSAKENAQKEVNDAQAELEKVKLHLTEEFQPELADGISLGTPQIAFTEGNTMLLQIEVKSKTVYQVAGVDAVIDGCLLAEVYEGETKTGETLLNLPRDGIGKEGALLKGHCLTAKQGGNYTVLILPHALWLIEKYACPKEVPTLNELIPNYELPLSWKPVPAGKADWRKILEERRREAKRKAAEEKAAAEAQAKKRKKIAMIATPIAVVAMIAAVAAGISVSRETQRRDAYDSAVEWMNQSFVQAHALLEDLPDDYERAGELKAVCEPYLPYCGDFICNAVGDEYFTSDFYLDDSGDVLWCPELAGLPHVMSVLVGADGTYGPNRGGADFLFFRSANPVTESQGILTVKDEGTYEPLTATVTFENSGIHYVLEQDSTARVIAEYIYTKDSPLVSLTE